MTTPTNAMRRLDRTYAATPEEIWEPWTTPAGIESWWAPDGFSVEVNELDLRPGGTLVYTMTATAPEQVEFTRNAGMPLATESRKTFTEVDRLRRLAYDSLIDFVPGVDRTSTGPRWISSRSSPLSAS
jgi:uncharacterized protein YndB with AHSA1/START domain